MAPLSSHDSLLDRGGGGGRAVWCHRGIKPPAAPPAPLSRISVPGLDASAGGTAVRRKNKTTRHWRPVVLFFSVGGVPSRLSLFSFWIFWLHFLDKEILDLKTALWASRASLCRQVSVFKELWLTSSSWSPDRLSHQTPFSLWSLFRTWHYIHNIVLKVYFAAFPCWRL